MSTKTTKLDINALTRSVSEDEMDRLLDARHDEIEPMLIEAREAIENGAVKPLPPLHEFLREARSRLEAEG